jgi:hypothetical protein
VHSFTVHVSPVGQATELEQRFKFPLQYLLVDDGLQVSAEFAQLLLVVQTIYYLSHFFTSTIAATPVTPAHEIHP